MQDKITELQIKLKVIKDNPEYVRIIADMLEISVQEAMIKIGQLRFKYQKEVKTLLEKQVEENLKQQKLF
jgi:hypothetical protein